MYKYIELQTSFQLYIESAKLEFSMRRFLNIRDPTPDTDLKERQLSDNNRISKTYLPTSHILGDKSHLSGPLRSRPNLPSLSLELITRFNRTSKPHTKEFQTLRVIISNRFNNRSRSEPKG